MNELDSCINDNVIGGDSLAGGSAGASIEQHNALVFQRAYDKAIDMDSSEELAGALAEYVSTLVEL